MLRNPLVYLLAAVLLMIKCELMLVDQFGQLLRAHPWYYIGTLVLTCPIVMVLVDRRTLGQWEESSHISAAAALQVKRTVTVLVLLTYGIVYMILGFAWRASQ